MREIFQDLKAKTKVIRGIEENTVKIVVFYSMVKPQQCINFILTNFFKKLFFLSSL